MAINTSGGGAATNRNGLRFEQEISLKDALKDAGFVVADHEVYRKGEEDPIAILASKKKLYKRILEPRGIDWEDIISKQLLPDEALYVYETNTVYIIEKKFQHDRGSVDEKLQTCDFKRKQYKKLFKSIGAKVEYLYVCNSWFRRPEYRDVYKYIEDSKCHIFFDEIPLYFLDLG